MKRGKWALIALTLLSVALVKPTGIVDAHDPARDGLTAIDSGVAAFYSSSWDGAGWDRIRRVQAANHGIDASKVYDADGWYCAFPTDEFSIGDVVTLRNENTGQVGTCVVADAVAPRDVGYWRARFVVEMSWAAFSGLHLDEGNNVSVWGVANA